MFISLSPSFNFPNWLSTRWQRASMMYRMVYNIYTKICSARTWSSSVFLFVIRVYWRYRRVIFISIIWYHDDLPTQPPPQAFRVTNALSASDCWRARSTRVAISYPESSGSMVSGLVARRDSGEMEFFPLKSGVPVAVRMLSLKTEINVSREVGMLDESLGYLQ